MRYCELKWFDDIKLLVILTGQSHFTSIATLKSKPILNPKLSKIHVGLAC